MILSARRVPARAFAQLTQDGVAPLLARLFAARGVGARAELHYGLEALLDPVTLRRADDAAVLLADMIAARRRMTIVADYDCDGATACAVGLRALRAFGAEVGYLVPNRFEYGYGLTPEVVRLAAQSRPDLLITVDNGIASVEGVAEANRLGIACLITDHHLPGAALPEATAIVNPNQPGCRFTSKSIAGVGVMFYVMLALRAELRRRSAFASAAEPNLATLLDLVALGTVADVVRLDHNNRVLVSQGLARMRAGKLQPGLRALFAVAGRDPARANAFDLGFALGPRVNAAGRLADMSLGIECLATENYARALNIAQQLDQLNRERRAIETTMRDQALARIADVEVGERASLTLFEPDWHQGVVGLVASKIRERTHRPVIAFAPAGADGLELRGSGRSIDGLHLRDALDLVAKREPGLLARFGGHAAAAGLTIATADLPRFAHAFEQVVTELLDPAALARRIDTDGPLESGYLSLGSAHLLREQIWGQGFPAPLFDDTFEVDNQRLLKEAHLKLALRRGRERYEAIWFNRTEPLPPRIRAAYRLDANEYNGVENLQLMIEHAEPAG
jgi:single-stranded-DNA-specific exonuclease